MSDSVLNHYPETPGFKAEGTSADAAEEMRERAVTLRRKALEALRREPMTADQVAAFIGASPLAVRPRITELNKKGLVRNTGKRRPNQSGKMAYVWKAL